MPHVTYFHVNMMCDVRDSPGSLCMHGLATPIRHKRLEGQVKTILCFWQNRKKRVNFPFEKLQNVFNLTILLGSVLGVSHTLHKQLLDVSHREQTARGRPGRLFQRTNSQGRLLQGTNSQDVKETANPQVGTCRL